MIFDYTEDDLENIGFMPSGFGSHSYSAGNLTLILEKKGKQWSAELDVTDFNANMSIRGGAPKSLETLKQVVKFMKSF